MDLETNWFRLLKDIQGNLIYPYTIDIKRDLNGRFKTVKGRHLKEWIFWEYVRNIRPNDVESFVYDGLKTVYTLGKVPNQKRFMSDGERYEVEMRAEQPFEISFDFKEQENGTAKFIKALFSQRIRYRAAVDEEREMKFAERFTTNKNSIYFIPKGRDDPKIVISDQLSAWIGLFAGLKQMENGQPTLNLGLKHQIFFNQPDMSLLEFVLLHIDTKGTNSADYVRLKKEQIRNGEFGMSEDNCKKLEKIIVGIPVKTENAYDPEANRFFVSHMKVIAINPKNTPRNFFSKHARVSFEHIYESAGHRLESATLPLVLCRSAQRFYYVPMCVLQLHKTTVTYNGIINGKMEEAMIKGATKAPHVHKELTEGLVRMLEIGNPKGKDFMGRFGVKIDPEMVKCHGRQLRKPQLVNKHGGQIEILEDRMYREKTVNESSNQKIKFALCVMEMKESKNPCLTESELQEFYCGLIDACIKRELNVEMDGDRSRRSLFKIYGKLSLRGRDRFQRAVDDAMETFKMEPENKGCQLFFLVFAERGNDCYGHIKTECDLIKGVPCQVITSDVVKDVLSKTKKDTVYYNIALKLNGKAGGINQELDYAQSADMSPEEKDRRKTEPITQYIGIDFCHPSPGSFIAESIVSVVMSLNRGGTRYKDVTMPMEKNDDMLPEELRRGRPQQKLAKASTKILNMFTNYMREQIRKLVVEFKENEGRFPDNVVVFRDGVGDSQLLETAYKELSQLMICYEQAIRSEQKHPLFSYIVCQKRHGTRFYELEKTSCTKKTNGVVNIKSGTVIDQHVVSPFKYEFYLSSHNGNLGTTRPCHYTVMIDEQKMHPDDMKELCYKMSFLSFRCRKPISIPVPIAYADLCCEKFKEMYTDMVHNKEMTLDDVLEQLKINSTMERTGMPFV